MNVYKCQMSYSKHERYRRKCRCILIHNLSLQIHFTSNETKRLKSMSKRDPNNSEVVVVVGGGPAAQEAVEALRNRRPKPFTGNWGLLHRPLGIGILPNV